MTQDNLTALLDQRQELILQIQAIDELINRSPQAPWLATAASFIRTNEPVMASQVLSHTYSACQQANLPAPSLRLLLHTLSALGFRRVRKAAGIYWLTPADAADQSPST